MVRMTIRLVSELNDYLTEISKKTGKSKNAIIVDLCWKFVNDWNKEISK